jgi:rare lipoprotein A
MPSCHRFICLLVTLLFVASCVSYRSARYPTSGYAVASWYGSDFHGKPTSSGEPFNMYALTCAHKEYPFGTRLKVTNTANGKAVQCLVNDRGPFVYGRDIDLSYAAAKKIDMIRDGIGRVRIEYLDRDASYIRDVKYISYAGPFTVQAGSFSKFSNASRLKAALELKYSGVYIAEAEVAGRRLYRIRIGNFSSRGEVDAFARSLADEGYEVFITKYDGK